MKLRAKHLIFMHFREIVLHCKEQTFTNFFQKRTRRDICNYIYGREIGEIKKCLVSVRSKEELRIARDFSKWKRSASLNRKSRAEPFERR